MPIYTHKCHGCGARFDRLLPMDADRRQPCACGEQADRVITGVRLLGMKLAPEPSRGSVPLRRRLPSSLEGVGGGREGVAYFQRVEERLSRFEEKNPEFRDEKMPVVSHERGVVVRATEKTAAPSAKPSQSSAGEKNV
ncbi:FmdB family zinc ribbon protein [Leucobacter soli]|uniref:Putative regulatory protein FmdB zinc ribbon domain-containing protein n=1 Tax=Leucobacter soli TaxID=2812850 RepID=A0A916NQ18_9MICO|nr:FmdB family zinc ribbon protein [Leucobacter soli]CAG7619461.1 hypothetical protein LEUCIP111803_02295 [Leucobacter soli]